MNQTKFERITTRSFPGIVTVTDPTSSNPRRLIDVDLRWEPCGPDEKPRARLISRDWLSIAGLSLHVFAYEVENGHEQSIVAEEYADVWAALGVIDNTRYVTTEIEGRTYIIIATPHGD